MHIFLIGLMGSGKTYWANQIATHFNWDNYDLDHLIEVSEKKIIADIFYEYGENYFRHKEKETLEKTIAFANSIIATGGGTPCFFNNMEWMNEHGTTIWIDEDIDTLTERLKKEKHHRPLIKNLNDDELKTFVTQKLEERKKHYSQSKYHLAKENINKENFIKIIQQYV